MHAQQHSALHVGLLEIRPDDFLAYCDGRRLTLTGREFALITELARRANRVVSREELYLAVWGGALRPHDRSVDVYVRKLRAKLARVRPHESFIETHFGFGYRLAGDESSGLSQVLHNGVTNA